MQDAYHKKMDYKSELIALLEKSTACYTIRNMFFDWGLCRSYGAHNPMNIPHGVAVG
jgi:hypothetical protein